MSSSEDAPPERPTPEPEGEAAAKPKQGEAPTRLDDGEVRMDLPKWNRARVKRKTAGGEETDAFQKGVRRAGRVTLARAPIVIGAIVLVAASISAIIWLREQRRESAAEATRLLAQAVGIQSRAQVDPDPETTAARKHPSPIPLVSSEEERVKRVREALDELARVASDGDVGRLAPLVEGAKQLREGAFDAAAAAYEDFLKSQRDHALAFLAREGLALAHEGRGEFAAARDALEPLTAAEGAFYRDQALWQRGRLFEAEGQPESALEVYRAYAEAFPLSESSLARDQVVERLQELDPEFELPAGSESSGELGGLRVP